MFQPSGSSNKRKAREEASLVEPVRDTGTASFNSCSGSYSDHYDAKRPRGEQNRQQYDCGPSLSPGPLAPQLSACAPSTGFQRQQAWPVPRSSFDIPRGSSLTPTTSMGGPSESTSDQSMQGMQSINRAQWPCHVSIPEASSTSVTRSNSAPDLRLMLGGYSGQSLPSLQTMPFSSATARAMEPYVAPEGNRLF